MPPRALLSLAVAAALGAVDPARRLPALLPVPDERTTRVIAAGKAAAAQLAALLDAWPRVEGLLVVPHGSPRPPASRAPGIRCITAGHPLPDAASVTAGEAALALAAGSAAADRLIVLLSGGSSALLEAPADGIAPADLAALNRQLLGAGADIATVNGIRRKLSRLKGGRLAAAFAGAELWLFALSDVPGDVLADIGSGPCAPDPVSLATAQQQLAALAVVPPPAVAARLADPAAERLPRDHACFTQVRGALVGRPADARRAVLATLVSAGWPVTDLGEATGPTLPLAEAHAGRVAAALAAGERRAFVSGGETTHALRRPGGPATGTGGRNTAYLLRLALALGQRPAVTALAMDTDGIDGHGGHAGAWLDAGTLDRARAAGIDPATALATDDSAGCFAAAGDLHVTGPTGTNVNDLRIVLTGTLAPDAVG